jgi:DNA polymerase V
MSDSELRVVEISQAKLNNERPLPAFLSPVQAGFPSPADDYIENHLDLNGLVVQRPAATFFVRVEGESMTDANIHSGDILVVDRSIQASNGKIVVAVINGEFTVKRFILKNGGAYLLPENPKFPAIKVEAGSDFQVWGVVTYVIHKT